MDSRMASFRIPARHLIRYIGNVQHKCSFTRWDELKPFEHCVLLRQALNWPGVKGCILSVQEDRDVILFRTSCWLLHPKISWEGPWLLHGWFYKASPSQQVQGEIKGQLPGLWTVCWVSTRPLPDISKTHKEDNIKAIDSTPRPSLMLEEMEARDQLMRAVDIHEMFYQVASKLHEGTTPPGTGEYSSNFEKLSLLFFSLKLFFRKRGSLFRRKGISQEDVGKIGCCV